MRYADSDSRMRVIRAFAMAWGVGLSFIGWGGGDTSAAKDDAKAGGLPFTQSGGPDVLGEAPDGGALWTGAGGDYVVQGFYGVVAVGAHHVFVALDDMGPEFADAEGGVHCPVEEGLDGFSYVGVAEVFPYGCVGFSVGGVFMDSITCQFQVDGGSVEVGQGFGLGESGVHKVLGDSV